MPAAADARAVSVALARAGARRLGPTGVRAAAAAALCVLLAGCGGGISLGFNGGHDFDDPPSVSLVASADSAAPGQVVRLSAAASDDFAVDEVEFLRIERDGSITRLGTDRSEPYTLDTPVPDNGSGEVRYFARAFDDVGQRSDSADIVVRVTR
jgi:Big-like domain-containing protein